MDTSYKQEVSVGVLVILAIVLFIVGSTWLKGQSIGGDLEDYWKIQFHQAANLKASSPVRVSGVSVGKVEHIELQDVGKVLVYISLADRIQPRVDAKAQVVSVGFVGDAAVELDPGRSSPGTASSSDPRPRGSPTSRGSWESGPTACSCWRRTS
jgi:phospholipid/cholesterol/gamma-HCH transport system substrate-binding protein